jgi:hypothetical protein
MELKEYAASLLTNDFLKSRPDEWDLVETLLTKESVKEIDAMTTYAEFKGVIAWLDEEIKRIKGASYTEILWLLDLIDKHGEALNYDCISLGLRLRNVGSEDFTWGDLLAIVRQSPRSSALYRSTNPEEAAWGLQEHLLATIADYTAIGIWQRGQGSKKDRPKPIPRPGVETDQKWGKDAIPVDEMAAWLGWE